jgi:hypothetical protein
MRPADPLFCAATNHRPIGTVDGHRHGGGVVTLVHRTLRSKAAKTTAADPAAPDADAETTPKRGDARGIWPEQFIGRHFLRMPPSVRVGVYVLLVAAYVHNSLQESILMGQLWIRSADGREAQAANYVIQTTTPYATNAEGRWALPAGRRLPLGSIEAEVLSTDRVSLGTTELCLPLPIVGPMLGSPHYRIVYDETSRTLSTRSTPRCVSIGGMVSTVFAAMQPVKAVRTPNALYVTVRELTLRNTGHADRPAEVYLRIFVDGQELRPRGFPSKDQESTWLLLVDGKPAALNNLTFTIPSSEPKLMIEVWDRDRSLKSFFRSEDDRLASLGYNPVRNEVGARVLADPRGTTMTVEFHR